MTKRLRNSPIFSSVRVGRCAMSTMCSFRSRARYMTRAVSEVLSFLRGCLVARHPETCGSPPTGPGSGPWACRRAERSDAAALGGTAAVVSLGRHVLDRADLEACGLQRADRRLATRARALHEDVDLLD